MSWSISKNAWRGASQRVSEKGCNGCTRSKTHLAQLLQRVRRQCEGDGHEGGALERGVVLEALQLAHDLGGQGPRDAALAADGQPRVLQRHVRRPPLVDVGFEQAAHKIAGLARDCAPNGVFKRVAALADARHNFLVAAPVERRLAGQQHEGDHADGPHVAGLGVGAAQDLGRHVVGGTGHKLHALGRVEFLGQPKIDQLDLRVLALALKNKVLQLDVPVRNALAVHVRAVGGSGELCKRRLRRAARQGGVAAAAHCRHDLRHHCGHASLGEAALGPGAEPVVQVPTPAVLHDQIDVVLVLEHVKQPNYVGVRHVRQQLDLALHLRHHAALHPMLRGHRSEGRVSW